MNNGVDAHMKQRAYFIYRLMQKDMAKAQELALSNNGTFTEFFEDKNDEVRERLFQEFNSLSVVYQKPSERFLKETELKHSLASEKKYFPQRKRKGRRAPGEATAEGEQEGEADQSTNLIGDTSNNTTVTGVVEQQSVEDLIGLGAPVTQPAAAAQSTTDDLLGLGAPAPTNQPAAM